MMPGCRPRGSNRAAALALAGLLLSSAQAAAATHEVAVRNFAFDPPELTITAGDSVRWTVVSGEHSVTAKESLWDSDELATGVFFERRFEEPGVYAYFCTPHDFMRGTVTVLPRPSYGSWATAAGGALLLGAAALLVFRRRAG